MAAAGGAFPIPTDELLGRLEVMSVVFPSLTAAVVPLRGPVGVTTGTVSFAPTAGSSTVSISPEPPVVPVEEPVPEGAVSGSFVCRPGFAEPMVVGTVPTAGAADAGF